MNKFVAERRQLCKIAQTSSDQAKPTNLHCNHCQFLCKNKKTMKKHMDCHTNHISEVLREQFDNGIAEELQVDKTSRPAVSGPNVSGRLRRNLDMKFDEAIEPANSAHQSDSSSPHMPLSRRLHNINSSRSISPFQTSSSRQSHRSRSHSNRRGSSHGSRANTSPTLSPRIDVEGNVYYNCYVFMVNDLRQILICQH